MLTCGTDHLCALTLTPSSPTFIHPHSPFHSHPQRKPNATPSTDGRRRSEEPQRGIEQSRAWASELAGRTAGKLAGDRGGARGCGTERGSGTRSDWRGISWIFYFLWIFMDLWFSLLQAMAKLLSHLSL